MSKIKNPIREKFNKDVLNATYKAQKKYGFEMGTGEHATWNNEADASNHTDSLSLIMQ